jgi:glycosyltransferase involved in cell wall biosynthesis
LAEIVFVLPSFAGGGAERVALTLAGGLGAHGFTPSLVAFSADGPLATAIPPDLPVHVLGRTRLRGAAWPLLRHLRRVRPDLVVSTLPHVNVLLGACRPLLPKRTALLLRQSNVVTRAGVAPGRATRFAYAAAYRNADAIVALTAAMAAELEGLSARLSPLLAVVPNPVDTVRLRAAMAAGVPPRRAAVELVASGRLVPQKNVAGLLDALAAATADWRLTILGDGPERTALVDRAARLGLAGRIAFAGFTDRPAAFLGAADAFVMASLWEGMPNAALEALACGTPVIGPATIPALAELARSAPHGVRLFRSPDELARLVDGLHPADRAASRPSLLPAEFGLDAAVAAFAAVAEAAIARRRGGATAAAGGARSTR